MRTAIIGAGGIAEKAYFPMLSAWQNLEIAGFYSYTQKTVDDVSNRWGFDNGTTDLSKILELKPENVIVISKTSSHFEICRYFLENGVDVFCEKALTDSSAQSYELAKIAEKNKCILVVGFNRRYALLCRQAKEIWGDRKIDSFIIQKHRTRNNHKTAYRYFLDDAIHQVDFLRFFCGDLEPVECIRENKEDGNYAGVTAVLNIPNGGHAIFSTVITGGAWQENFSVHGGGMSLTLDMFRKLTVRNENHEVIYGRDRAGSWTNSMLERGFEGEVAHFFECCKTREIPHTNGLEAAKTQELMENLIRLTGEKF